MASNVFEIYTFGGGEILEYIFNGIAMFFNGNKSFASRIIQLAAIFSGFWVIVQMIVKNNLLVGAKWFVYYLIAAELLFATTTSVVIIDGTNNLRMRKVDNVPIALAMFASLSSKFGKILTEKFEQNFSVIEDVQYSKTGMVFGAKLMGDMLKFHVADPAFQQNLYNYIDRCVTNVATIGHKYDWAKLKSSPDIWELVSTNPSKLWQFIYRDEKGARRTMTCADGTPLLNIAWKNEYKKFDAMYSSRNFLEVLKDPSANQAADSALSSHFRAVLGANVGYLSNLQNISANADQILQQALMLNAIVDSSNNKLENYSATKALLQQKNHYQTVGYMAQDALPVFKVVLESLIYASFIFILIFALLPNGWTVLATYFQLVVWVQLWPPLYAILGSFEKRVGRIKIKVMQER